MTAAWVAGFLLFFGGCRAFPGEVGAAEDGGYIAVAYDAAEQICYERGWTSGVGREISYGEWNLLLEEPGDKSQAGHYLAGVGEMPQLSAFAQTKTFAMFANGPGFEQAVAQRIFNSKISDGDVFSACLFAGGFGGNRREPDGGGSMGIVLSTEGRISKCDDYNKGAAVEFGIFSGKKNYFLYDGDGEHDTGCPVSDRPVSVSSQFLGGGRYRAQIAKLGKNIGDILGVVDCPARRLRGAAGAGEIRSMVFFDRNGDLNDFHFDDIVLDRHVSY